MGREHCVLHVPKDVWPDGGARRQDHASSGADRVPYRTVFTYTQDVQGARLVRREVGG